MTKINEFLHFPISFKKFTNKTGQKPENHHLHYFFSPAMIEKQKGGNI